MAAALCSIFDLQNELTVKQEWDRIIAMHREKFPAAAALTEQAREEVMAFQAFPPEHSRKIWSTKPLERLDKEIKRRNSVFGIFRNGAEIIRLVCVMLLEQQE